MPDASPAKWHRAHTTWFFEQFLLGEHCEGYKPFTRTSPICSIPITSAPAAARPPSARPSDPSQCRRSHRLPPPCRCAVVKFFHEAGEATLTAIAPLVEVGLNHEQQHQELMLTDILHAFAQNPILPAYDPAWTFPASRRTENGSRSMRVSTPSGTAMTAFISTMKNPRTARWWAGDAGAQPRHQRRVACLHERRRLRDADAMADGRFAAASNEQWQAPATGGDIGRMARHDARRIAAGRSRRPGLPRQLLRGRRIRALERQASADRDGVGGRRACRPSQRRLRDRVAVDPQRLSPYPGYRAIEGALGEYNGKFMVNQLVLRGSSLATPEGHSRITYRNFFYPIIAGNSRDCASPTTRLIFLNSIAPESACRREL
jgi:hypothetical protein